MKIQLLSDLHLEFFDYTPQQTDADVVVLAGDVHTKERAVDWAEKHFKQPVLYVLGNHDYWGGNLERSVQKLKEKAKVRGQVHVLEGEALELDGVRFYGATFWTDFELHGRRQLAMYEAGTRMNDYRKIRHGSGYHRFKPEIALKQHALTCIALGRLLEQPFDGKTVVISHHAPHSQSLEQRSEGHVLDASYASDLTRFFGEDKVALWLHGHVHDSLDYVVNGTRVVCNPRGYIPEEPNPGFREDLVVVL